MAPNELSGRMVGIIGVMETLGFTCAGAVLELATDIIDTELVFVLYLVPIPLAIVQTLFFIFGFNHESPSFLWMANRRKEAISLINVLYLREMNQEICYEV